MGQLAAFVPVALLLTLAPRPGDGARRPQRRPGRASPRDAHLGPSLRRAERLTGAVLVGLGVRLAFERR